MKILTTPTNRVFQGAVERRCPLCRCNLAISLNSLVGEANCPNCGLDVKKLETSRLEPTPLKPAAKPAPSDPLERWLSGDAVQPKSRTEWEHVALWIRKHPRVSSFAAVLLVAAVVVPISLFSAYSRTSASLKQAAAARTTAERERLELAEAVDRNLAELKMHQERLQGQQQEHEWLKNQFRELQTNYQQSQQQVRIAENLLHGTLHDSRPTPSEQTSVAAPFVQTNPTAAIPAPLPVVQANPPAIALPAESPTTNAPALPVVQPNPPSAIPVPPQAAAPAAAPAIVEVVQPPLPAASAPAAVVIQEVLPPNDAAPLTAPAVESAPPQIVAYEPAPTTPAPAQQIEPSPSAVNSFQTYAIQATPASDQAKSSFRLIGEVQPETVEVSQTTATPNWDITPADAAPPVPAAEGSAQQDHRVQDLISRMEEMRARGQNTAAPVTWQSKKSELFRLE
jgi:hypothetical protein